MVVYILHFHAPLKHARHYVGFSKRDAEARFQDHISGIGARITQVCNEQGITYEVARVFKGKSRTFERQLKRTHNTKNYCPICMGHKVRKYKSGGRAQR